MQPRKPYKQKTYKRKKRKSPILLFLCLLLLVGGVWAIANTGDFLSDSPIQDVFHSEQSQQSFGQEANKYLEKNNPTDNHYPLNLQTDERWSEVPYGDNTLGVNGCAIASLSMILSEVEGRSVEPTEILDWSHDAYFVDGAGTSWNIFADFASYYGLPFQNLDNSIDAALNYLEQGIPVVVSVSPGEFTDTGHIMILSSCHEGQIKVYDPNDTPEKNHYKEDYSIDQIASQVINYWVYA
ncbi:hypothetical protein BAU15_03855 [Enterococcus sp. JM4C]|nr:hypothetical protein BAU15_03855 [Enterococcus sp. JM4C]